MNGSLNIRNIQSVWFPLFATISIKVQQYVKANKRGQGAKQLLSPCPLEFETNSGEPSIWSPLTKLNLHRY